MTYTVHLLSDLLDACAALQAWPAPVPRAQRAWRAPCVALAHRVRGHRHRIILWRTYAVLNWWYSPARPDNVLGEIVFDVLNDRVKIVSDDVTDNRRVLASEQVGILRSALLRCVVQVARAVGKDTVIIDVHYTMRDYHRLYIREGFLITSRRCADSPYWFEAELETFPENETRPVSES